jgi:hypothetical protein
MISIKSNILTVLGMVVLCGFSQIAQAQSCNVSNGNSNGATKLTVGSKNPINGFPLTFRDANGETVEICLDGDGVNGICIFDPPVPGNAFSQQIGFGAEAFWWSADATIDLAGGGRAILVQAIEAAFLTEDPADGDQFPFTRLRIRIDIPQDGTYVVTHPFGQITYNIVGATNNRDINDSFDIEIGGFNTQHQGRIGPILKWDPNVAPAAPAGYVGDPQVEHEVTGSPCGTNFFQIDPPAGVDLGAGPGNPVSTNLFAVQGKIATVSGVQIDRASYNRSGNGNGRVDVIATSSTGQVLEVTGIGSQHRVMVEEPNTGRYFARMSFNTNNFNPATAEITVTNLGDQSIGANTAVKQRTTDTVTINLARFTTADPATDSQLQLRATSNDAAVTQTMEFFDQNGRSLGTADSGDTLTLHTAAPPSVVTARSSGGGSETREVVITGINIFE